MIKSLVEALALARPKQVLAISDYGAHVGHNIGMSSIFRDFKARLHRLRGRRLILRSAEDMQNWGRSIPAALASGILPSFQDPVDMAQPTISAKDLGQISAEHLLRSRSGVEDSVNGVEVIHAEGPRKCSAVDVATALGRQPNRPRS